MEKIKNKKAITLDELNDFMNSLKIDDWYVEEYIGRSGNEGSWGRKAVKHKGGGKTVRNGITKVYDFSWAYEGYNFSLNNSWLINVRKATDEEIKKFEERKAFFDKIDRKQK